MQKEESNALMFAASSSLRKHGNPEAAGVLDQIMKYPGKISNLIKYALATILTAINTTEPLNADKFGNFALKTAKLLKKDFNFWPMSPSVHKVLVHGREIIKHHDLPIGMNTFLTQFFYVTCIIRECEVETMFQTLAI